MTIEFINLILTNVVVAGIISTATSYFVSIRLKNLYFRNEVYKQIVERRLNAYQSLEKPISDLKSIVLDTQSNDARPYHAFMSEGEDKYYEFLASFMFAFSENLWLDDKTNESLEEINQILFVIGNEIHDYREEVFINTGKKYYDRLSEARFKLENSMKEGLYSLHDVRKALKVKKNRKQRVITSSLE